MKCSSRACSGVKLAKQPHKLYLCSLHPKLPLAWYDMGACASSRATKEREAALIDASHSRVAPNVVAVVKAAFLHAHFAAERHRLGELARAEGDGAAAGTALDARAHAAALALWKGVSGTTKKQLIARGFDVLHEVEEHEFGAALWARLTAEERSEAFREAMCVDIELETREAARGDGDGAAAATGAASAAAEAPEAIATAQGLHVPPPPRIGSEAKQADDARLHEMRALHAEVVAAARRVSSAAATPWTRFIAEESGHYYYTHEETGESVWLLPVGATAVDGEAEHTPVVAAAAAEGADAAADAPSLSCTAPLAMAGDGKRRRRSGGALTCCGGAPTKFNRSVRSGARRSGRLPQQQRRQRGRERRRRTRRRSAATDRAAREWRRAPARVSACIGNGGGGA